MNNTESYKQVAFVLKVLAVASLCFIWGIRPIVDITFIRFLVGWLIVMWLIELSCYFYKKGQT